MRPTLLKILPLGAALIGGLASCNHHRSNVGDGAVYPPGPNASGSASVTFVDRVSPDGPKSTSKIKITKSMTGYVRPQPIEPLVLPVYPAQALAAHVGSVRLAVTIKIGKDGHVTAVGPSAYEFSTPTKFDAEFNGAIEAAVLKWTFDPGWTVPMEPGPDGTPVLGEPEPSDSSLDAIFTFTSAGAVVTSVRE